MRPLRAEARGYDLRPRLHYLTPLVTGELLLTMTSEITETPYPSATGRRYSGVKEHDIETALVEKLRELKYTDRPDIRDRATLEANFRQKFETLNRVRLTDGEFSRLLDELVTPDVFTAARVLREKNDFIRDDGTPLSFTLVNIKDWCKNDCGIPSRGPTGVRLLTC